MASIFKRRNGKRFLIDFTDPRGRGRRISGFSDRSSTKELAAKIERAVAIRQSGGVLMGEMLQWLETLRPIVRDKLAEWGVIDPQRAAAGRGIKEHIDNWKAHSLAKGNSGKYVKENTAKVIRTVESCKWESLTDINSDVFIKWLADMRNGEAMGTQTANHYLRALRTFCNWLTENRLVSENPIRFVHALNARIDRRYERRALDPNEIGRLLAATEAGKRHHGLTGRQRALVYRLAIESGLRYNEIRSLTPLSFDLESNPATVTIAPEDEKAGRGDTLPVRPDLAADLKTYLAFIPKAGRAFPLWSDKGAAMIQRDLKAAGVPVTDDSGRIVDFHALRTTFGSLLNLAGVPLKTAQDLMRHSDPKLTANFYTLTTTVDRANALAKLPVIKAQPVGTEADKEGSSAVGIA